jgi:N-acetylglutamate synthase-like GNAT family acetyltransferase
VNFQLPEIRPASLADVVALEALLGDAVRYVLPGLVGPLSGPLPLRHLASLDRMLIADGTALIVEAGGESLAFGAWSRRDRDPATAGPAGARALDLETEAARVLSLAVRADFTGRGLAAGILETAAAQARAEGYRRLVLLARPEAVAMAIRCGFDEVGRRSVEVDGKPVEAIEMALRLRRV